MTGPSTAPPVRFTTARTEIRRWRPDEADRLLDIRRRPEVARWLGDPTPWTELVTAQAHIEQWTSAGEDDLGTWAIVPIDRRIPAGTVKLDRLPGGSDLEIGWSLHPDAMGQGYASEAARCVLAHGLTLGRGPVWAVMWPHNEASARVCVAIGMTDLGVVEDPWYGTDEDPLSRMFRADGPVG